MPSQEESIVDGSPSHCDANVPVSDPCPDLRRVTHCVQIGGERAQVEVGNALHQGGYRAYWTAKGVMMNDFALGAIFGVGNANVALSAVRSVASVAECGRIVPCRHNRMSHMQSGIVRFCRVDILGRCTPPLGADRRMQL